MHQNSKSRSNKTKMKKSKPVKGYAKGGLATSDYQTTGFGAATKRNQGKTHILSKNA